MNLTPIGQAKNLPDKTALDAIEGVFTKIYPEVRQDNRGGTYQNTEFKGSDGQTIRLKLDGFGHPGAENAPHDGWLNRPVRFVAGHKSHIVVEVYQGKTNVKVKQAARLEDNPPDYGRTGGNNGGGARSGFGAPQQQAGSRAGFGGQPPPQNQGGGQQQGQNPGQKKGIPKNGQMVGMCLKLAADVMQANTDIFHKPSDRRDYLEELYILTSDYVRLSEMIQEEGKIATSLKVREEKARLRAERDKQQQRHYTPDPEHQRPPNSAESGQASRQRPATEGGRYGGREAGGPAPGVGPTDEDVDF